MGERGYVIFCISALKKIFTYLKVFLFYAFLKFQTDIYPT